MTALLGFVKTLLKGIVVGLGAITPGLSGSVLLVIFGLYQRALDSISTIFKFKNLKKNILFLVPLALGIGTGMIIFSNIALYFFDRFSMQTRFTFFGLVVGTLPLFIREVTKEKRNEGKKFPLGYVFIILGAAAFGLLLTYGVRVEFPQMQVLNPITAVLLGLVVAASYIIPGIDSAVILTYFGMYDIWLSTVGSLKGIIKFEQEIFNLDFLLKTALPLGIGLATGVLLIATAINLLLKRHYTVTFSIIFGLFVSIIPNLLKDPSCALAFNGKTAISLVLMVIGFFISLFLSDLENNLKRLKIKK